MPQIRVAQGGDGVNLSSPMGIETVITYQCGRSIDDIPFEGSESHTRAFQRPAVVTGVIVLAVQIMGGLSTDPAVLRPEALMNIDFRVDSPLILGE